MDKIKQSVADALQKLINDNLDTLESAIGEFCEMQGIEIHDLSSLQQSIRVKTSRGPRYFLIQISEQI